MYEITNPLQAIAFLRNIYIGQILYTLSITTIKLSVLAFYWRLFEIKSRKFIYVVTAASIAWCIAIVSRTYASESDRIQLTPLTARLRNLQLLPHTGRVGHHHHKRKMHSDPRHLPRRFGAQCDPRLHHRRHASSARLAPARTNCSTHRSSGHVRPWHLHRHRLARTVDHLPADPHLGSSRPHLQLPRDHRMVYC